LLRHRVRVEGLETLARGTAGHRKNGHERRDMEDNQLGLVPLREHDGVIERVLRKLGEVDWAKDSAHADHRYLIQAIALHASPAFMVPSPRGRARIVLPPATKDLISTSALSASTKRTSSSPSPGKP